ncbi:hypothetical protein H5079_13900 [Pseudoalteromonas sp. SG44-5]|uniref:hypothetical protein n=1 Tax=Pseudoalteromonas sp. SG44-5 TaxID=2760960 RepID=UPI0015FDA0D0|nr:hypothetical protein [Pseudoalteromonas sp. SG44-5]MBB1406690.1 hypothetical protein [Pseudoalteromonas sp. SG44-5]
MNVVGSIPTEDEEFTVAYVDKATCRKVQVWPVPEDLENWHEVDFDPQAEYMGKWYNPDSGSWFSDTEVERLKVVAARKRAYATTTDPLFMEWQYDQTPESKAAWVEAVAKVKLDFPFKQQ